MVSLGEDFGKKGFIIHNQIKIFKLPKPDSVMKRTKTVNFANTVRKVTRKEHLARMRKNSDSHYLKTSKKIVAFIDNNLKF